MRPDAILLDEPAGNLDNAASQIRPSFTEKSIRMLATNKVFLLRMIKMRLLWLIT